MSNLLHFEDVRIGFKNFEGKEGKFNRAGDRSFVVFLEPEQADELYAQGWNVKFPQQSEHNADPDAPPRNPYLQIAVAFDNFPPDVHLLSNGNHTKLDGNDVGMLDWAELERVDLVVRPYSYTVTGKSGIKAYLKKGYFTIVSDKFTERYGF